MNRHVQSAFVWDEIRNADCEACPLAATAQTVCLLGDGPVPCDAMIVGEAPGQREDDVEIPFSGKSGIFLRKMLKDIGLDPRKIYITNVVACRPPTNRTPTNKEAKTCSTLYLRPQLEKVKPKVVLLLGNTAVSWAMGRKAAVTKMEGSTFTVDGITCVPSRHPSAVIRIEDYNHKDFLFACQKFKENLLLFKRTLYPPVDELNYEKNLKLLRDTPKGDPLYTDIETNGLSPFRDNAVIHSISVSRIPSKVAAVKMTPENEKEIVKMLENHPIIVHRGTFEGIWFRWKFGKLLKLYHDTKLGAFVQDENSPTGLKFQAISKLRVDPWSEEQDWEDPDFDTLLPYNARDTKYGLRLYREHDLPFFRRNPKVARLLRYILLPAEEVFVDVICRGVHINLDKAKERLTEVEKHESKINRKINKIAGREVNIGSPKQMSRLLYDQLKLECPIKTAKGAKSTSEAALIRLRGQHPVTDMMWDWRGWNKKKTTYLIPWIAKGPILHFNYGFTDVDTGRLNSTAVKNKRGEKKIERPCPFCSGTNPDCRWCEGEGIITVSHGATIHQCPRDGFIRNLVSPRGYSQHEWQIKDRSKIKAKKQDWCIVAADLSQVELRLVAHASSDPTMCEIFQSGGDIHQATAMDVLGKSADQIDKETRKKAKAVNFGFVYGMWWRKFIAYALEKFDLKLTELEGKNYRKGFFRKYDGLKPWHRRVEAFVTENGFMDSVFGRRRHLPSAMPPRTEECKDCSLNGKIDPNCFLCGGEGEISWGEPEEWIRNEAIRQGINSPIQSAGSDLNLLIASLLNPSSLKWHDKLDNNKAFLVASAHDSQIYECHRSYVDVVKGAIRNVLDRLPYLTKKYFDFEFSVPIEMDCVAYSDHWEGTVIE